MGDFSLILMTTKSTTTLSIPNCREMDSNTDRTYKLYFKRWLIIAVCSLSSTMNNVTWISLSSITSIVQIYYNVNPIFVECLALVYSLSMSLLLVPSSYFLNRFGLRLTVIIGGMLNALGCCTRLLGAGSNGFVFVFVGSCICGLSHAALLFLPPHVAAVWFGEHERTVASSIGMLVSSCGIGLGFLLASFFVSEVRANESEIGYGMRSLLMFEAVTSTALFIACICIVRDAPPTPPSRSQDLRSKIFGANVDDGLSTSHTKSGYMQLIETKYEEETAVTDPHFRENYNRDGFYSTYQEEEDLEKEPDNAILSFNESLKALLRDKHYNLLCQAYAIYTGSNYAYTTVINRITVSAFPGKEKEIGYMGFASLISGLLSMILSGAFLNKTKNFKAFTLADFALAMICTAFLTIALHANASIQIAFVLYVLFGFFTYAYISAGLEYVAEITYPVPEIISTSICLLLASGYGVILTQIIGILLNNGFNVGGYIISGLYALGFLLVLAAKGLLKRTSVDESAEITEKLLE